MKRTNTPDAAMGTTNSLGVLLMDDLISIWGITPEDRDHLGGFRSELTPTPGTIHTVASWPIEKLRRLTAVFAVPGEHPFVAHFIDPAPPRTDAIGSLADMSAIGLIRRD